MEIKKEFVYPGVFHKNADGSYTVTFPDLPGCITEGKSLKGAINMARKALGQWKTKKKFLNRLFLELLKPAKMKL